MQEANRIFEELKRLYPVVKCELDYRNNFELLIAVVLSAQTTDKAVNKVTVNLFKKYPDAFKLAEAKFEDVHPLIKTIGLANTKARNIIALAKRLVEEQNGEIPADFDYLISLPGVGRKTANVVLGEGFRIPTIPVDTHVLRVANRLRLANSDDPYKVELSLMEIYDPSLWYDLHLRLIHFGRYFCKAQKPNCMKCKFIDICQYYTKNHPSK
jgi:endonuclease-3